MGGTWSGWGTAGGRAGIRAPMKSGRSQPAPGTLMKGGNSQSPPPRGVSRQSYGGGIVNNPRVASASCELWEGQTGDRPPPPLHTRWGDGGIFGGSNSGGDAVESEEWTSPRPRSPFGGCHMLNSGRLLACGAFSYIGSNLIFLKKNGSCQIPAVSQVYKCI